MTHAELITFLETKMSMSHIYQPLLIKTLIDAGGSATLRQLAQAFLSQDESQLIYYEDRIKQMPLKSLGSMASFPKPVILLPSTLKS
jgi:ATP adenylyltransferase